MQQTGIGFFGILTIIFTTLKLTHNIDWSWWVVLSPLYVVPLICVFIFGIMMVITLIKSKV